MHAHQSCLLSLRQQLGPTACFSTSFALQARPIEEGLAEAIDEGRVGPRDDPKIRSKILSEEFGWDKDLAKKIWCFGPDTTGKPYSGRLCSRGSTSS